MLPSDFELVTLCGAVYAHAGAPAMDWDYFDAGLDDGVCWAIKRLAGFDAVVLRGSVNFEDWMRDLRAAPIMTRIGHVHDGFHAGMEHAWADIRARLTQTPVVTGHSLGAARAAVLTGFMVRDGIVPAARVVFGEPKPGFVDLAEVILSVPGRSYRNGGAVHHDLITDVPFSLPPFEYVHPTPIIPVCAPPAADDRWGAFCWHHIELYQTALAPSLVAVSV